VVTIKTKEEIEILRESGWRLAKILGELKKNVKPGISAKTIDEIAFRLIKKGGDEPAFLGYRSKEDKTPFPASICLSVNEELVHALPGADKVFKEGDIVSIDAGINHQGLITDSATTVPVGKISKEASTLLRATRECLEEGIKAARGGNFIGDIGFAIENKAKEFGLSIAEGLVGHGVGYDLHEDPYVPNFGKKGEGLKLEPGMVIAIEPMLCLGSGKIVLEDDGFAIRTKDKKLCAHFEHTIAITENKPKMLTAL